MRNLGETRLCRETFQVCVGRTSFEGCCAIPLHCSGPQVITYCRTGMQSSLDYFVAKYLGYAARMYDGSFYEWSRSSHPVENMTTH
ncbi:MAG: rhodanese-like domain-containing protein [Terriglobales bacterium]